MIYGLGLGCYLLILLVIGYLVKDKIQTVEDFLVAGRKLNLFFNSATLTSCFIGGATILGVSGAAFSIGIWNEDASWGIIPALGGATLCLVLAGMFYMRLLWKMKFVSLGDFFYTRYGRTAGIISTTLISLAFVFWIAVQVVVFSKIVNPILGWPMGVAILVAITVICAYTMLGGLWAVCMTDIVQVSIIVLGVFILMPVAINHIGGWVEFTSTVPADMTRIFPKSLSVNTWLIWIAAWMMVGLGSIASPDLMQRAFAAKSAKTAKNSALVAALILFIVGVVVTILGLIGYVLVQKGIIDASLLNNDPELILPVMFKEILPIPLVVLFLGAGLAAVMSAADSALLALAGMLVKNLYKDVFRPDASNRSMVKVSRILVLIIGVVAALIAAFFPFALLLAVFGFDLILACLFIPLTLGLYWNKANEYGALAGMIIGFLYRFIMAGLINGFTLDGLLVPPNWYIFTLSSPVVCLITMVIVSLATQKASNPLPLRSSDGKLLEPL